MIPQLTRDFCFQLLDLGFASLLDLVVVDEGLGPLDFTDEVGDELVQVAFVVGDQVDDLRVLPDRVVDGEFLVVLDEHGVLVDQVFSLLF